LAGLLAGIPRLLLRSAKRLPPAQTDMCRDSGEGCALVPACEAWTITIAFDDCQHAPWLMHPDNMFKSTMGWMGNALRATLHTVRLLLLGTEVIRSAFHDNTISVADSDGADLLLDQNKTFKASTKVNDMMRQSAAVMHGASWCTCCGATEDGQGSPRPIAAAIDSPGWLRVQVTVDLTHEKQRRCICH
jgi:hypothetical protein